MAVVVELCQLRYADVWEVLRTEAQETPFLAINRRERELVCQIPVFLLKPAEVTLRYRCLVILLRYGVELQQSGLPQKDCLYLKEVVTMMVHGMQWNGGCPPFKGIAVHTEAIAACQRHEIGIIP